MAIVRSFKGVRPSTEFVDKVAALPYDVMSSDEAREMVKDNPYSFLHVDKAEIDLDKDINLYDNKVYAKAKENLENMHKNKVMIADDKPVMYIYTLVMDGRPQTGIVACTSIDEYLSGVIKKHEHTREDKEQDRIRHVETCNANTGPIFLAYRVKDDINTIIENWKKEHKAIYDFISEDGIQHIVWVIDDEKVCQNLSNKFKTVGNLYIADGHHRNASAVKVGLRKREKQGNYTGEEEYNYYLSVIFPDEQLYIMDYNRLLKDLNGLDEEIFKSKIAEKFEVTESKTNGKPSEIHNFGMYLGGKWYNLKAKPETIKEDPVEALDVSILQNEVLTPILNIGDVRTSNRIDFVGGLRGLKELERRVDSAEMKLAFAMFPTSMGELLGVADAGLIMPPKSTWFEPKLRSGLFIHYLD